MSKKRLYIAVGAVLFGFAGSAFSICDPSRLVQRTLLC